MLTPYLYTALLVYMSTLAGNFSISGAVFFVLFLLHSFAYYGYRIYDDPIDMLTDKRRYNKSLFLRRLFLWLFVLVGITYFVGVIFVRVSYDYEDGKLVHLENKESLKQDMIALERSMSKIIPDFLSNWTIFRAVLVLVFAIGLIFIQWSEEAYAEVNDEALMTVYTDIYRDKWQKVGQNGQIEVLLVFKPWEVQKCVLIFKDYKFKVEIFCVLQVIFLVFIANAQYCLYGVPYLAFGVIHLLTIALSHAKSDQTIRVVASVLNVLLLLFLPMDLGLHYSVHYIQESQRIDA